MPFCTKNCRIQSQKLNKHKNTSTDDLAARSDGPTSKKHIASAISVNTTYTTKKCGNYSCIASRCARTRSHSLALASARQNSFALTRSPAGLHSLKLANAFELAKTRSLSHSHLFSFACLPSGSHSFKLTHFLRNSFELARLVLQNHSVFTLFFHAIPHINEFAM